MIGHSHSARREQDANRKEAKASTTQTEHASNGAQPTQPKKSKQSANTANRRQNGGYALIAAVYLLGLFIGALDMGIVTPCRTVIQNDLGIDDSLGIWMLTIYTLAYAASIPIMGKLADRHGRKYIYLTCVFLFGLGSLLCGLAQNAGSFGMLIAARAIQAIGGGGIMPVATAEFGTAFPEEKRGMALGLVGGVYGIANVFGSSAGSLILDIFGQTNWQFIFFVNVPICLFIIIAGLAKLPNTKEENVKPIDGVGICVMTVMILSLMYGLKNLDFFDLGASLASTDVFPFLLGFIVLLPVFVAIEHRAADPVMNLSYFKNRDIVITLVLAIATGVIMIATIFVPQFCENSLFIRSGAGGYFVIILGLFAGLGSPMSGTLIDRFGVKPVLGFGFAAALAGALVLIFVACPYPSAPSVIAGLVLVGLGMGFTMGTPLNYMMLQKTDEKESNSALATLSLVRSLGTAVAPAIMVAFVAQAGMGMQSRIMEVMPNEIDMGGQTVEMSMDALASEDDASSQDDAGDSGIEITDEMRSLMENSDVTTIADNVKTFSALMFDQMKDVYADKMATAGAGASGMGGVNFDQLFSEAETNYLESVESERETIEATFQQTMNEGFQGCFATLAACSAAGVVLLLFFRDEHTTNAKQEEKDTGKPQKQAA